MKSIQGFLFLPLLLVGVLCTTAPHAYADGSVTVTLSPEGQDLADSLGIDVADFESSLNQKLSDAFDTIRPEEYLRAISDAVAFSNRGIGVDYSSGANRFQVGIAGNVSLALGDQGLGEIEADRPVAGVAPNLSLMVGWNLAELGYPALTVFANGFHKSATVGEFTGTASNLGAHAQWRLFRNRGGSRLRKLVFLWGGVDITGGFEFSRLGLSLNNQIETQLPVGGAGGMQLNVLATSTGNYDLTATALTLPIEATTSLRAFYFFWLYGGIGADLQLGGSSVDAQLGSTMTAVDPSTQETITVGTANVSVGAEAGPSVGRLRFLAGIAAEVLFAKIFVQANMMPDRSAGVAFGLRFGF